MSLVSFLRKLGLRWRYPTEIVRDAADIENALRENNQVFSETATLKQRTLYINDKLAEAIKRTSTPFADLENLTTLKRDIKRKGMGS